MFSKIKEKLSFALIAAPIYAQETIKIEPEGFGKEVTSYRWKYRFWCYFSSYVNCRSRFLLHAHSRWS